MLMVTVWMTSYNHEKYIAEALDGILMQQTNFAYEIVLGDDCSTDKTRDILLTYQKKHPDKLRLFLPEKNLGMLEMTRPTYALCRGKYLAFLDGDDYWTDPLKLQKQVDFMEANPQFSFCFHNAKIFNQHSGTFTLRPYTDACYFDKKGLSTEDFLRMGNTVWTLSVLMRNVLGPELPDWYDKLPFPDLGMYFLLLKHGNAGYIDETMGVYRAHSQGAWSGASNYRNYSSSVKFYLILKKNTDYLDSGKLNEIIARFAYECLKTEIVSKWYAKAASSLFTLLQVKPKLLLKNRSEIFRLTMHPLTKLSKSVMRNKR